MIGQTPFNPSENGLYKILSGIDQSKCLAVQQSGARPLVLDIYKGASHQKFSIFDNNGKFALVSTEGNSGLWVANDASQDGAPIQADSNQHKSSFFEIIPVKQGPLSGIGFYVKTFCNKSLDLFEGRVQAGTPIIQWSFHGNTNQIWLIVPADDQIAQTNNPVANNVSAFQEVSPHFAPVNTSYKILSVVNTSKALTIANTADHGVKISDYVGDPSQKFNIFQNNNKFAFVVTSYNEGICVFQDKKENGAEIKSDPGQHGSSYFDVVQVTQGQWAKKAYKIKTHAGKTLDICEGNMQNGTKILQWDDHGGANQQWIIVPSEQVVPKYEKTGHSNNSSILGVNLPNVNLPNIGNFNNIGFPKFG